MLGGAQTRTQSHDPRHAGHEDPVTEVDRRGVDADQHIAVADRGFVDVLEDKDVIG